MLHPAYNTFSWKNITFNLRIEPQTISVCLEYLFANVSPTNNFYFTLLPGILTTPTVSLLRRELIEITGTLVRDSRKQEILFSKRMNLRDGMDWGTHCLLPIPWPSAGYIPPDSSIILDIKWEENHHKTEVLESSRERWTIHNTLFIEDLFLPHKFPGGSVDRYFKPLLPEDIEWCITFPVETSNLTIHSLSLDPQYKINPYPSEPKGQAPFIRFNTDPGKQAQSLFKNHILKMDVDLNVRSSIHLKLLQEAEERVRRYVQEVCVAAIDLKGSSAKAEEQRDQIDPSEFQAKFLQLAREAFPFQIYNQQPLKLLLKKTAGDEVMLVVPAEKSPELAEAVLSFLTTLSNNGFQYRAGFHADQAMDTGAFIYSANDFGTDFSGPALNYAGKVGNHKESSDILLTAPAATFLEHLKERYDLIPVDRIDKVPHDLLKLEPKESAKTSAVPTTTLFSARLVERVLRSDSRVCVGLDPDLVFFPKALLTQYGLNTVPRIIDEDYHRRAADCIIEFNRTIIDIVSNYCAAVKPQSAYYERFGHHGIRALSETVRHARKKGLIVILDAKRNDIGSTAKKYACAYLGGDSGDESAAIPFDAITVNAYLGSDGINPFIEFCEKYGKGIFVLVKTSNPSSSELQELLLSEPGVNLAGKVARMVNQWASRTKANKQGYSSIGAVVGATQAKDIKTLREVMPGSIFLMPGYGKQGAKAEDIRDALDANGLGALINSSRGITYPCSPEDQLFFHKVEEQVRMMRDDLNRVINKQKNTVK